MTYAEYCATKCEWCAKGYPIETVGDRVSVIQAHRVPHCDACNSVGMRHCSDPDHCGQVTDFIPCTAPTRDQFEAELQERIRLIEPAIEAIHEVWGSTCPDCGPDRYELIAKHAIDRIAELERENAIWKSQYETERDIVSGVWKVLGNPTYESLRGKSIYDCVEELRKDKARLEVSNRDNGRIINELNHDIADMERGNTSERLLERTAQLTAHRACCGEEHNPEIGKIHGYCIVCGVPWPCEFCQAPGATLDTYREHIAELERENGEIYDVLYQGTTPNTNGAKQIALDLLRENAELRKDKARLDWVEDPRNKIWEISIAANPQEPTKTVHIDRADDGYLSGCTWRDAIDAAMQSAGEVKNG